MTSADLLAAVRQGDVERVRALLDEDAALADARDEQGVSALMLAYYHGEREAAEPFRGRRPLDVFEAATVGDAARLKELLDAEPSLANAWSSDRATPLHFAAFFAQPETAGLLLERGADVHAVSPTFGDVTPLHSAAAGGSAEIVRALLAAGADPNARQSGGFVALHSAALGGDLELARDLLAHGADPAAETDDGRTALSFAEQEGHGELATFLREA